MPTLVFDPQPTELEQLLERRHRLDQDRRDEVWEGVLHIIPPPSHEHERIAMTLARLLGPLADAAGLELTGTVGIGVKDDYRVPDLAVHRPGAEPQWHPTAALVVEIVSPGDKSWEKLGFYAAHRVDELLIVDPIKRKVDWLALGREGYGPADGSALIDLAPEDVARRLGWSSPPGRQTALRDECGGPWAPRHPDPRPKIAVWNSCSNAMMGRRRGRIFTLVLGRLWPAAAHDRDRHRLDANRGAASADRRGAAQRHAALACGT